MCIVAAPQRLASAAVVFFGHHGDISQQAQLRHVSRPVPLPRSPLRAARPRRQPPPAELARLQQQVADLQTQVSKLQAQRPFRVLIDTDKQAEFASTAQAEGDQFAGRPPSLRCLSRPAHAQRRRPGSPHPAGRSARPDSCWKFWINRLGHTSARPPRTKSSLAPSRCSWSSNPRASVGSSRSPVHQPRRHRLGQRISATTRSGACGACDGGTGLANGPHRVISPKRQENYQPVIGDQLPITFTRCGKAVGVLRKTQSRAERAWTAAEEADKKVAQQDRQGQALTSYATQAVLKWQGSQAAFHQWEKEEGILKQIRQELQSFTQES